MLVWIGLEPFGLFCPDVANIFLACQPFENFEPLSEVIAIQNVCNVSPARRVTDNNIS